ncbi:MAG TPA: dihydrodipicolinate synthase family protein [Thermodesulfobacteriota bacterium]|nr:dihydrodipicolinate synthase family protein [Thermodesulfobacteriota bacterium]
MPLSPRGIIAAVTTPFRADGQVDYEALGHNLVAWRDSGLAGFLVLGSTGELVTLSAEERRTALEVARAHVPRGLLLLAGAAAEATAQAIALAREAAQLGADAVLLVSPSYYKPMLSAEALRRHYTAVADAAPVPLFLYNVPMFTGLNLEPALVARLAAHPNILGLKDSSGNVPQLAEILRTAPAGFLVFTGAAPALLPALALGAAGAILQLACVVPELCVRLVREFDAGDLAAARRTNARLLALHEAIGRHGIPATKAAMELRGYRGGLPRPPLLPAAPEEVEAFRAALRAAGELPS